MTKPKRVSINLCITRSVWNQTKVVDLNDKNTRDSRKLFNILLWNIFQLTDKIDYLPERASVPMETAMPFLFSIQIAIEDIRLHIVKVAKGNILGKARWDGPFQKDCLNSVCFYLKQKGKKIQDKQALGNTDVILCSLILYGFVVTWKTCTF